ncbi:MAG TPA: type II toxin-antitoxin system VapC family toxin [Burkholderiales bacterium]|nr:type II toxin-antitoxin system VapC family toxin [Burkholderiales bacterium]
MILYLDTSALVKLFVHEQSSDTVREAVSGARLVVTHAIAYVEACAVFARVTHERKADALFATLRGDLDVQWKSWEILQATDLLIRRAADFAGRYRLRGYDSLHLAAAAAALDAFGDQVAFHFGVFDDQLRVAARQAGVPLLDT